MTIGASGTAPDIAPLERAHNASAPPVLLQTPLGTVVGGTLNGDVIILSPHALALLRAGGFIRALLLGGIESLRQTVALAAGRVLMLEYGIYRVR